MGQDKLLASKWETVRSGDVFFWCKYTHGYVHMYFVPLLVSSTEKMWTNSYLLLWISAIFFHPDLRW